MSAKFDESALITQAVAGDAIALQALLFQNERRLLAYVLAHFPKELNESLEPQDVVQDSFVRAIRSIKKFQAQGADSFFRWLVTIARNQIADQIKHKRNKKRKRLVHREGYRNDELSVVRLLEDLAVYKRTPSKSAASHELLVAIERAVDRLPTEQSQVLRFRHLEGMDVKEVASKMGKSEAAVMMLCTRGMKSLRLEMGSASLYI